MGLIPGWGRSPGEGHSNPLQYCCLENPMDRGAWQATVPRIAKSPTPLKGLNASASTGSRAFGLQWLCCMDSVVAALEHVLSYWCSSLVAPWHVGSSQTKDRTVFPALTGGCFTTELPGKPPHWTFIIDCVSTTKGLRTVPIIKHIKSSIKGTCLIITVQLFIWFYSDLHNNRFFADRFIIKTGVI